MDEYLELIKKMDEKRASREFWCEQYTKYMKYKLAVEKRIEEIIEQRDVMELNRVAAFYISFDESLQSSKRFQEENNFPIIITRLEHTVK